MVAVRCRLRRVVVAGALACFIRRMNAQRLTDSPSREPARPAARPGALRGPAGGAPLWLDVALGSPPNGRGLMNDGFCRLVQGRFPVAAGSRTRASVPDPAGPRAGVVRAAATGRAPAAARR
jgi:hypothetical protein